MTAKFTENALMVEMLAKNESCIALIKRFVTEVEDEQMHGGDHFDGDCPVCVLLRDAEILLES